MIVIGVDVGTTRTKVLALDVESCETLALEAAETPVVRDGQGEAHRPAQVLEAVVTLLARVSASLAAPERVAAICCASVGEEVVLLDEERRPIGDAIAWFDPRGRDEAGAFLSGPGAGLDLSTRYPPDPSFSLFKLLWLQANRPADLARARAWTDLGDTILLELGGALVMDWTHASRAGAFDIETRAWDGETIRAAGLVLGFPPLVSSGSVIGTITSGMARRTGLPGSVAIVTGGHDHLCAAYGAGLRDTGELFLSAGTSEAHLALLGAPTPGASGRYRLEQGCYVDDRTWYGHVAIPSGHVFRQWRDFLYPGLDEATMDAEVAAAPPDADGITFDLLDDLRHARLDGLPYTADRAVILRAILEGLARRSADIVAFFEAGAGVPITSVLAAGHATRQPYWRGLRQAAYGRPLVTVDEPESAAFGAAVLGARAVAGAAAARLIARRIDWSAPSA
jgi:xylulokinase